MQRYSCAVGCHFDLCGRCFARELTGQNFLSDQPVLTLDGSVGNVIDDHNASAAMMPSQDPTAQPDLARDVSGLTVVSTLPDNASADQIFSVMSVSGDQPDVLRRAEQSSVEQAECAICYDDLCIGQVSVLCVTGGGRSCRHFFHTRCIQLLTQSGIGRVCPLCRMPFAEARPVPSPAGDPAGWFRAMDADCKGKLKRQEVSEALRSVFPVDTEALNRHFDVLWARWDKTGSGDISIEEFLNAEDGLLTWVIATSKEAQRRFERPPDIQEDRRGWFRYWVTNVNGSLDKEELIRALLKSYRDADVMQLRSVVGFLWTGFFQSFPQATCISFEEFSRPRDGLLDLITANIKVEGESVTHSETGHAVSESGNTTTVGRPCTCGKVHAHRGDRVHRGPAWTAGHEDGGAGQFGTIVREEEARASVFVQWDFSPLGTVHCYGWPADPRYHAVVHTPFDDITLSMMQFQEQTGFSSAAILALVRRVPAAGSADDMLRSALETFQGSRRTDIELNEDTLRSPIRLFDRCRLLPDKVLVKQWFDTCPPCPCPNPECTGGVRWNPEVEKHLGREGYVVKIDTRDDTVRLETTGRCNCAFWCPRMAVEPVLDMDVYETPRFPVGTRVQCKIDEGWQVGTIKRHWWRNEGFGNRRTAPYQVALDDERLISAPQDRDETIRAVP